MTVPSLQSILEKLDPAKPPYTRSNFIRYLSLIHCLENFEFINDVNKYNHLKDKEKPGKWAEITRLYLLDDSPKEINLPYQYKHNLLVKSPSSDVLKKSYKIIYELLLDSYNQFINVTKKQNMSSFANYQQGLPIPGQRRGSTSDKKERRGSNTTSSRRSSVVEIQTSRRGLSLSNLGSGMLNRSSSILGATGTRSDSRRPSITPEYPKLPINNGTATKTNIVKLPSPLSDVEVKKKSQGQGQSLFKMKKFKFRRNSNE